MRLDVFIDNQLINTFAFISHPPPPTHIHTRSVVSFYGRAAAVLISTSLSVHRSLISALGTFGKDFTEDSQQFKGFRFLSKSGITHPNWDL